MIHLKERQTDFHGHALIMEMIEGLRAHDSRTEKAAIMKGMFLAKVIGGGGVFEYFLYKHGPYSTDIEEALEQMKSYQAIVGEPAVDGYSVKLDGDEGASAVKRQSPLPSEEKRIIERVCCFIQHKSVQQLERLSTASWIRTEQHVQETEEVARRLHELRPHITMAEARLADQEILEFMQGE